MKSHTRIRGAGSAGRRKTNVVIEPNTVVDPPELFHETATLTSAAAATAVVILSNAKVGSTRSVFLWGFVAKVDGATDWATTATVVIGSTEVSPTAFVTLAVAAMTGNSTQAPGMANITLNDAYAEGTGGTAGYGLQLKGNANGTGSDWKCTVWGLIK